MTVPNPVAGAPGPGPLPHTVLEATVEKYHLDFLRSARRHANGNLDLGADVLQQTYENILKRIAKGKDIPSDPLALKKYIHKSIGNVAKDAYKTYGSKIVPQGLENPYQMDESDEGNPEELLLLDAAYSEIAVQVKILLNKLPEKQREVVNLMFWEQKTKEEVAEELAVTVGTVTRYLYAAKENLKKESANILKEVVV
ncbi:sigma-70 family RNA polymerase sigma factor [Streptomyces sp. NPDC006662]|uniref:RNA polymerase sigma factor n=1 Tax=Streptomyces sp. NPDC006662 TaxID=3156902 RepID=UPI0033CE8B80